jgi:hypothetical protein
MMDWGNTNGNPVANWAERTPVDWPSYTYGRTVPSRGMSEAGETCGPSFTRFPLIFARELCQLALPPLVRGVAAI